MALMLKKANFLVDLMYSCNDQHLPVLWQKSCFLRGECQDLKWVLVYLVTELWDELLGS